MFINTSCRVGCLGALFLVAQVGIGTAAEGVSDPALLPHVVPDRSYLCYGPVVSGTPAQMAFSQRTDFFVPSFVTFQRINWTPEHAAFAQDVNLHVNSTTDWVTDQENFGTSDLWVTGELSKDCEDGVLAKIKFLRAARDKNNTANPLFPEKNLRIAVVRDGDEGHAVLIINALVEGQPVDFILDNKNDNIKRVNETGYTFYGVTPPGDKSALRRVVDCPKTGSKQSPWTAKINP